MPTKTEVCTEKFIVYCAFEKQHINKGAREPGRLLSVDAERPQEEPSVLVRSVAGGVAGLLRSSSAAHCRKHMLSAAHRAVVVAVGK